VLHDAQDLGTKEGDGKQVTILTVDRVELKGKYYAGGQANAPCVMLLHAFGDSCSNKEWINFAKKLHENGYAVLMFDFRGHGDSTSVQAGAATNPKIPVPGAMRGFWDEPVNQQNVKGYANNKPRPTEIKYEQFSAAYFTVLANDIAAAKAFLDEQQDCNSSNLIVIGANEGAVLGALWLNAEFHRYRYLPAVLGQPESLDKQNPEGQAVKAAVWLSLSPTLGSSKKAINVAPMLDWPAKIYRVPMLFLFGEADTKGADVAKKLVEKLVPAKFKKEYPHTEAIKVVGAEQMTGKNLLLKSLDTTDTIVKYLASVPDSKVAAKSRKNPDDNFVWEWIDPQFGLKRVIARKKGNDRLEFAGYANFLR